MLHHPASPKVSSSIHALLEQADRGQKVDAIVLYESDTPEVELPLLPFGEMRGRTRSMAAAQRPLREGMFAEYLRNTQPRKKRTKPSFAMESIGGDLLPVASVEVTSDSLPALADDPRVLAVIPNQAVSLISPQRRAFNEPSAAEVKAGATWGLEMLDIPALWSKTKGENVRVAVLDTGVHGDHPALKGRVKEFVAVDPLGRRITSSPMFDSDLHGTHVCGTIAGGTSPDGVAIGVAPKAEVIVGAVLIGSSTLRTLIEGISWAVENGAHVISLSLGFTYFEPLFSSVFDRIIRQYGVLPVVAIGNENHGNSSSPGSAHNALSIGAVQQVSKGKTGVAFFSSGASLSFPGQQPALVQKPDVTAPGVDVYSCVPPQSSPQGQIEYAYLDGTSMATPHVSGVVALLRSAKPKAPVSAIIQALQQTASHPDGTKARPDNRWGFGLIQPAAALAAL